MARSLERDILLHGRMKTAYQKDMLDFYTNAEHLNRANSPVFDPWEAAGPFLILILLSLFMILIGGIVAGTGTMFFSALLYVIGIRPWLKNQQREHAIKLFLQDHSSCQVMWDYGGIAVSLSGQPETMVASPEGDWRNFVRKNFPDVEAESIHSEMASTNFTSEKDQKSEGNASEQKIINLDEIVIPDKNVHIFDKTSENT